ncbi:unnamed protein product [Lathyrus oleraceus]|uniref:MBD domain-containing protein n=1 Tax=Pisum sativum TaxID=3888 RepID=A0A9D5AWD5_PEA|nr:uncharacterized protein LOC127075904 [Pisum sativum]KAI5421626.1 hypothetical protein KIW84_045162 [Pisum sativum]
MAEESLAIPTGWNVKSEVQKNGSIKRSYYCPDTGQHFYTYPNLIRYVNYAKRNQVGVYKLCAKSIRKREDEALKKSTSIGRRKTSAALSIRGRPPRLSNSDSLAAAKNDGSKPSSSGESVDKEKDEDYIPDRCFYSLRN